MSELKLSGKIKSKLEIETGTSKAGKSWSKQSFVIDTGKEYNPDVCFSLFGDKVDLLNNFKEGQEVEVKFNVSSREFNGKYYHNLDCWFISGAQNNDSNDDDMPY